jgi:hypothetical protein
LIGSESERSRLDTFTKGTGSAFGVFLDMGTGPSMSMVGYKTSSPSSGGSQIMSDRWSGRWHGKGPFGSGSGPLGLADRGPFSTTEIGSVLNFVTYETGVKDVFNTESKDSYIIDPAPPEIPAGDREHEPVLTVKSKIPPVPLLSLPIPDHYIPIDLSLRIPLSDRSEQMVSILPISTPKIQPNNIEIIELSETSVNSLDTVLNGMLFEGEIDTIGYELSMYTATSVDQKMDILENLRYLNSDLSNEKILIESIQKDEVGYTENIILNKTENGFISKNEFRNAKTHKNTLQGSFHLDSTTSLSPDSTNTVHDYHNVINNIKKQLTNDTAEISSLLVITPNSPSDTINSPELIPGIYICIIYIYIYIYIHIYVYLLCM